MLIDEQYIKGGIIYNMDNYSLKDGDRIMFTGNGNVYTIGNEFTTDKRGKYIVNNYNTKFLSNYFILTNRIHKDNYWHYYYSNSSIYKLLKDYREINNNHICICKEQQIKGIKNRIHNIVEYGLIDYITYGYTTIKDLYCNRNYKSYEKECEELNISEYYYYDRKDNKLILFNNVQECKEFINKNM